MAEISQITQEAIKGLVKQKEEIMLKTIYEYMPELKDKPIEKIAKLCELRSYTEKPDIEELWCKDKLLITFIKDVNFEQTDNTGTFSFKYKKHI